MTTTAAPSAAPVQAPLPTTRDGGGPIAPGTGGTRLRYEPGIDGLRALSVLAVIGYHAGLGWLPGGFLGVEVFFAVSGYLITSLLVEERRTTGAISLRKFWTRRARRLLPALYVLLFAVSVWALLFARDALATLPGDVVAALFYVSNWWQIVQDQSYFVAIGRPALLRHLWSLAIEEQFYLVFPPLFAAALARLRKQHIFRALVAGALASTILMAVLYRPYTDPSVVYYGTWTRLSGLLLGGALAMVWSPRRLAGRTGPGAWAVLDTAGGVGLAVLVWSFLRVNEFDPFVYRGGFLLVDLATLLVIVAVVHPRAHFGRSLGVAPLVWIGVRSYGLYLWHWPIVVLTRPGVDVGLRGVPLIIVRLGLTFLLTELSYRYIEQPIRHGAIGRLRTRLGTSTGVMHAQLARRSLVLSIAGVVCVALVGVGLARVAPTAHSIPGLDAELVALGQKDPNKPVIDLRATTTTVAPITTAPPPGTPTTQPPASPVSVTAIGDSVMLGAQRALQAAIPGITVDAAVSRQFRNAPAVLRDYKNAGALGSVVVIHLGTNGFIDEGAIDEAMEVLGRDRRVIFVNNRVPRQWEPTNNERLAAAVVRYRNATLIDWRGAAGGTDAYWASDGFHVEAAGAAFYAELVGRAIAGES